MKDPVNEVAPLKDLLHSALCRIEIAQFLYEQGKTRLLPTVIEDLYYGTQLMIDGYCVKK